LDVGMNDTDGAHDERSMTAIMLGADTIMPGVWGSD
jgi:hypothetical protein